MSARRGWAYCDVRHDGSITFYGVADDHHTQARPNIHGIEARRWVEEAVAWLGAQGWELVAVVQGEGRTFYFKRPLDDEIVGGEELLATAGIEQRGSDLEEGPDEEAGVSVIDPARLIEEEFLPE
ncbi:MAG TPA: hypothetical protein VM450_17345 [Thermomicrobiales bacterium]|jgi:hypothetical protein|nr:hypothetical protein [Thermomicrobiales bacterium]